MDSNNKRRALAADRALIAELGGSTAVSKQLNGVITPQAVNNWTRRGIPTAWRLVIEQKRADR